MLVAMDGQGMIPQLNLFPTQYVIYFSRHEFNMPFIENDNNYNNSRFSTVYKRIDSINTAINKSIPLKTLNNIADSHFPISAVQEGSPISYRFYK